MKEVSSLKFQVSCSTKYILCYFFFSLFFFTFSFSSFAQKNTATFYGKITDKEGKPLSDVKISVTNSKITTNNNEKGEYELVIPSDTNIAIEFSHVSFGIRLKSVHLSAGKKEKSDISIDVVKSLDTVVIEDKGARANFIQAIPTKDIYVQSGASGDFNVIV